MEVQRTINNVLTYALVAAALVVAALVVRRELFSRPDGRSTDPTTIANHAAFQAGGQLIGDAASRVRIVQYSDFQCPACRMFALAYLPWIEQKYGDTVAIVHKNWPLSIHPHAQQMAAAGECAGRQGKFELFYRAAFSKQDSIGVKTPTSFALEVGVIDTLSFNECLVDSSVAQRIQKDVAEVQGLNALGTPAILVSNLLFNGAPDTARFEKVIRPIIDAAYAQP